MKMYEYEFPNLFLKVSSKREYLEDLKNGRLFMNESGYFRELEDTYRGDRNDGKCPISMKPYYGESLIIGPADKPEERIEIPISCVENFVMGFSGDEKIPIYCCSVVSEEIVEQITPYRFRFREEYLAEMKQFGEYVAVFDGSELIQNIMKYATEKRINFTCDRVTYTDISSAYSIEMLTQKPRNQYAPFFVKDVSYRWQNEWRLVLESGKEPLIGTDQHHYLAQLPPLSYCYIAPLESLLKSEITLEEKPDETSTP